LTADLVTIIRNLQRRGSRRRGSQAVLETTRLCEEALDARIEFVGAVYSPRLEQNPAGTGLLARLRSASMRLQEVSDQTIKDMADTDTPQGVLAVIKPRIWTLDEIPLDPPVRIVVLDGVRDPGNVGPICRSGFGLGAGGVVLLTGTARLAHPKVLRAAAGATFRFPVVESDVARLTDWLEAGAVELWAAASGAEDLRVVSLPPRVAIAIGNEGAGVGPDVKRLARRHVAIPLAPHADSLNAATAAALLLYEVLR